MTFDDILTLLFRIDQYFVTAKNCPLLHFNNSNSLVTFVLGDDYNDRTMYTLDQVYSAMYAEYTEIIRALCSYRVCDNLFHGEQIHFKCQNKVLPDEFKVEQFEPFPYCVNLIPIVGRVSFYGALLLFTRLYGINTLLVPSSTLKIVDYAWQFRNTRVQQWSDPANYVPRVKTVSEPWMKPYYRSFFYQWSRLHYYWTRTTRVRPGA